MKLITNKKIIFLLVFVLSLSLFSKIVFAVWDGNPYSPGQVDNPECLPSQNNCDVLPAVTAETDPVFIASQAFTITGTDITNLSNLSGTNSGDNATNAQYSGLATSKQDALGFTAVPNTTTINGHALSSDIVVTASDLSLGNVTNESKTTMFTSPTFTGAVSGITPAMVGLGNVPNLSFSGSNTGDETTSSIQTKLGVATTSTSGYLTSTDWNTFNNKQPAGSYLTSFTEIDPVFSTWLSTTPPLYSYTETDPIYATSQAYNITSTDITNLGNLSGINTGDNAVNSLYSGLATSKQNTITTGTISQYFKGDLSLGTFPTTLSSFTNDLGNYGGFLTSYTETDPIFNTWLSTTPPLYSYTETDPIYATSQAYNITSTDITNLGNLSGINTGDETETTIKTKLGITTLTGDNTGDQDLSGLVPYTGGTSSVTLLGTATKTYGMLRNTTAATAGQGLTIDAGGTVSGSTSKDGGDLILKSGISTGLGSSGISLYTSKIASSAFPYSVGEAYGGGYIAYIYLPGDPGYDVNAPKILIIYTSTLARVYYGPTGTTGATGTALGTGLSNTNAIIATYGAGNYAANYARAYAGGGYTDWYLPSKDEVTKIYATFPGLANEYWTSSEVNSTTAWLKSGGAQYGYGKSFANGYVYAVRTETYNIDQTLDNTQTERAYITGEGNFGLGVHTPTNLNGLTKFMEISDSSSVGIVLHDTRATNAWEIYNNNNVFNISQGATSRLSITAGGIVTSPLDMLVHGITVGLGGGGVSSNVALGTGALVSNTTGIFNMALGGSSLTNNNGSYNLAVGYEALKSNSVGINNVAIGTSALYHSGSNNNTAIGRMSLFTTTGTANIGIGFYSGGYETGSSKLFIDSFDRSTEAAGRTSAIIYGEMSGTPANQILVLGGGGNVSIGIESPTSRLHLPAGTATAGTAPLGFTSGTLLTVPVAGKVEFLTDDYFATITTGAVRKKISLLPTDASFALTATKTFTVQNTLTLAGTDSSTLNIGTGGTLGTGAYATIGDYLPLAGGTMTGGITNSTSVNPLTTLAESWIGPSSTAGVYFKGGNVGIGTANPTTALVVGGTRPIYLDSALGSVTTRASSSWWAMGYNFQNSTAVDIGGFGSYGFSNTVFKYFYVGPSYTSPYMVWADGGNVGMGTVTPTSNLQVTQGTVGPGTVSVSGMSVTGVGTQFLNTFKVGDTITVTTTGGSETKTITTITSDTALVTALFGGTAAAGTAYTLVGGERFAVKGNGNVGIGTTAPNSILDVRGPITGNIGAFGNPANAGTIDSAGDRFILNEQSNYRVSIGFTAIGMYLQSTGGNGTDGIRFYTGFSTATEVMRITRDGNLGIGSGALSPTNIITLGGTIARTILMARNTTAGTAGQGLTLSSGGAIPGTANLAGGDLNFQSGISTGTGTSAMHFFTATAGLTGATDNTPTEKMTILGSGNVGIGTTIPSSKLEVSGGNIVQSGVRSGGGFNVRINNESGAYGGFNLGYGTTVKWLFGMSKNIADTTALVFYEDALAQYPRFVIATGGNVGIGGSPGTAKLYVNGNVGIGTTSPLTILEIGSSDLGDGVAGPIITLGRNTNAINTGAGSINFLSKAGTAGYVWQDAAGYLRINTSTPTNDNDALGTIIGDQTSIRETKQDIDDYSDYNNALSMIVNAPLHTFRYIKEVNGYGEDSPLAKVRLGFIADEVDPMFMVGNSIDQVSVNGLMMASVKELNLKLEDLAMPADEMEKSFIERFYEKLIAWLGSSDNGLEKICVKKSDGTSFCVNGDQLEQAVNGLSTETPTPTAPVEEPAPIVEEPAPVEPTPTIEEPVPTEPTPVITSPAPVDSPVSEVLINEESIQP